MAGHDPDRAWIIAGLCAAGLLATTWAGAALASVLAGSTPPPADPPSVATALVGVITHPGDPSTAWNQPMPTAWLTWPATVVAAAAIGGAVFYGRRFFADPDVDGLGVSHSARYARRADLKRLAVRKPTPGRLIVGRSNGILVAPEANSSVCVVGASQSGKTSGLLVPAILEMGKDHGSLIATSVKGDVLKATQAARAKVGKVLVFDPTCTSVTTSATWTPLRAAGTVAGAQSAARALVDLTDEKGVENGAFWQNAAFMLLWPLFLIARTTGATMRDVVRWVSTHDRPVIDQRTKKIVSPGLVYQRLGLLEDALALLEGDSQGDLASVPGHTDQLNQTRATARLLREAGATREDIQLAKDAITGIWRTDERTLSNIYGTARGVIEAWSNPTVARSADGCDIDPAWLLSGDNTVYLVAPAKQQERLRPVFACLVADLVHSAFDQATRNGGRLKRPLVCALDEVANIAPLRELPGWCSTCSSHGILLLTIWQDRSQQVARFGREGAETIWNNSAAKIILSGLADHATAEIGSLLGDEEFDRTSRTRDHGGTPGSGILGGGRGSTSTQTQTRRLVSEDSLRRQTPGQALLVYRDLPPARLQLRPWYRDKRLKALHRAGTDPEAETETEGVTEAEGATP